MSRSYKKNPVFKATSKGMKTIAARKIRRKSLEEVPNGNGYKRFCDSWNICDQCYRQTLRQSIDWHRKYTWEREGRELTGKEIDKITNDWERWCKRK